MHTIDAAETIGRMVEFFPPEKQPMIRSMLAGVLRGVVSQRLLPRDGGGRIAAVEVMVMNERIAELIRERRSETIPQAIEDGDYYDMQTFAQALIDLVLGGLVDRETAANAARNAHDFLIALARAEKGARSRARPPETAAQPCGNRGRGDGAFTPDSPARDADVDAAGSRSSSRPALAIGSFLNVVAARVPARRSIVRPRSACELRPDRMARQRPAHLLPRCCGPLPALRTSIPRGTRSSSSPPRSSPPASCFGRDRRSGARGRLLRRPRRDLGDRPRAPHHPEPDRPARGGPRARRADGDRSEPRVAGWALVAAGALFLVALAYPGGIGMGDVKLALLLGAVLGDDGPGRADARHARRARAGGSPLVRHGARRARWPFRSAPFLALGAVVALFAGDAVLHAYLGS